MKTDFQVIQGGKVKSSVVPQAAIKEAYGRWSRALKPIGLGTLAWELGMSQNALCREFVDIVAESAWHTAFKAGRNSLWKAA